MGDTKYSFVALESLHFGEPSTRFPPGHVVPQSGLIRGLTVSTLLLLRQSRLDGLHLLNLAKYSPTAALGKPK